jgi:hypothetical protein
MSLQGACGRGFPGEMILSHLRRSIISDARAALALATMAIRSDIQIVEFSGFAFFSFVNRPFLWTNLADGSARSCNLQ